MNTPSMPTSIDATPGSKIQYLIKRRPTTSREELVAHWFASHMPGVIKGQVDRSALNMPHAYRYIATLFDPDEGGDYRWDGVAQLWWDKLQPKPKVPSGTSPTDTFQQKVEPYVPWATTEYVVIDGSENLKVEPLTLNAPFPCTRSGFYKVSYLVKAKEGSDYREFYEHWLNKHAPNVRSVMDEVGGFRYVVSQSSDPLTVPYAGMAELYFHDETGFSRYREIITSDGMGSWVDRNGTLALGGRTEMIGIP